MCSIGLAWLGADQGGRGTSLRATTASNHNLTIAPARINNNDSIGNEAKRRSYRFRVVVVDPSCGTREQPTASQSGSSSRCCCQRQQTSGAISMHVRDCALLVARALLVLLEWLPRLRGDELHHHAAVVLRQRVCLAERIRRRHHLLVADENLLLLLLLVVVVLHGGCLLYTSPSPRDRG